MAIFRYDECDRGLRSGNTLVDAGAIINVLDQYVEPLRSNGSLTNYVALQ